MQIATLHLDTHRIVKHLLTKGYSTEQAEGFIEAIEEINLIGIATKEDLAETKKDIQSNLADVKKELQEEIAVVRTEIADVRTEISDLRQGIYDFRTDIFKFMMIQSISIVGLTVTLIKVIG